MYARLQPDVGSAGSGLRDGQHIHLPALVALADGDDAGKVVGVGKGSDEVIEGVVVVIVVPVHCILASLLGHKVCEPFGLVRFAQPTTV